jgi:oligosaccharide reducing-end xylanase
MKNLYSAVVILVSAGICFSQVVVDTPYAVGTWRGFVPAAVSYTFDDGCSNQFAVAIPMFNAKGFKLTLFTVVTGGMFPGWSKLDSAALRGHEIASHTMTHIQLPASTEEYELRNSKDSINKYIPGRQCITMAYPYCVEGTDSICRKYYIAGRTCSGQIVPKNPANFYAISSFLCGSQGSNNSTATINALANNAASSNGWCVYLFHGIDNDGGYSPVSTATLQGCVNYMDTSRSRFWVETFRNVARYIKERNAASVRGVSRTADTITLRVTDTLNDTIYNYPLSIRRPLPSGWTTPAVLQGGTLLTAQFKDSSGTRYVTFDAVPDGGNVLIFRNGTGIKGLESGAVTAGDMRVWLTHKNMMFFLPVSAGPQLGIALYDLKGSRIAHFSVSRRKGTVGSISVPDAFTERGVHIIQISDGRCSWIKQFPTCSGTR